MSGEGGGIIVGGIIAMMIAPVIIGAAAIGAAAVGAYHLGRLGYRAAKRSSERKKLRVDQCSADLSQLYNGINQRLEEQRKAENALMEKASAQVEAAGKDLEAFRAANPSTEQMTRRTIAFRENVQRVFMENRQQEVNLIREKTGQDMQKLIAAAAKAARQREDLVQWEEKTEAAKNAQRVYASGLLRDAQASVRLAQGMKGQYPGSSFEQEVAVLEDSLSKAQAAFDNNLFQSSSAQAQAIVTRCAQTLVEYEQAANENMQLQTDLLILTESMEAEVKERRNVTFEISDLKTKTPRTVTEDLDDFSQGEFEKLQESIRILREKLQGPVLSEGELLRLRRQYDIVRKNANIIMNKSSEELVRYYDRMSALEVISDAMKEQNYVVDWALPEGDDPTQKLVVHFTNKISGNTVTVTLDNDMTARDVRNLALNIMFYYDSGAPVPEPEKKRIRKYLDQKLNEAGLISDIDHCTGAVNEPCSNTIYANEESVMEKTPRPVFRRSQN